MSSQELVSYLKSLETMLRESAIQRAGIDPAAIAPFCQKHGIILLAVFGSCVRGDLTAESDADIAYLADSSGEIPWRELIPSLPVDAHDLDATPINLGNEIAHTAVRLYEEKAGSFIDFAEAAKKKFDAEAPRREQARKERVGGIPIAEALAELRGQDRV